METAGIELETAGSQRSADDGLSALTDLVGLLADAKLYAARMAELEARFKAAADGEHELTAAIEAADEHERRSRESLRTEEAALLRRRVAAMQRESDLAPRNKRLAELIDRWSRFGEQDLRACDHDEALRKAQKAYGLIKMDEPIEDAHFGAPVPSASDHRETLARPYRARGTNRRVNADG